MDFATFRLMMTVGAQVNSALYLVGVFVAGLAGGNAWAWKLSLAALGVTYFGYLLHCIAEPGGRWQTAAVAVVWLSIALGAVAGLSLVG